jgi:hypothetical protein
MYKVHINKEHMYKVHMNKVHMNKVHMRIHVYEYVCICIYIHMHIGINIDMYLYSKHKRFYIYIHIYVYTYEYTYKHSKTYICIRIHIIYNSVKNDVIPLLGHVKYSVFPLKKVLVQGTFEKAWKVSGDPEHWLLPDLKELEKKEIEFLS